MNAERVKTPETTQEVSSQGAENRVARHKCQRRAPFAREKRRVDWKKDLQICGAVRKLKKVPRWSWAGNQMGNVRLTVFEGAENISGELVSRKVGTSVSAFPFVCRFGGASPFGSY
jgi:hypothetical protein